jgi:hypothetical protein
MTFSWLFLTFMIPGLTKDSPALTIHVIDSPALTIHVIHGTVLK